MKRTTHSLDFADYVAKVLTSPVYEVASVTPVEDAKSVSERLGCRVFLKREDLQPVHSFKLRGAYCKMRAMRRGELERGVIAASAGNHAQGVALSATRLGVPATIVMPVTTPEIKVRAVRSYGAKIVLSGEGYSEAAKEAARLVRETGLAYIPPYDDPDVIAGQGTVAKELVNQVPDMGAVYVPVGGGGFAAGVAAYLKSVKPSVKVYGVEPEDSDCMYRSIEAGRRVTVEHPGLFVDGVCVKTPGREPFRICRALLDGVVRVSTDETCAAIKDVFEATRSVCEPAGALALAAAKKSWRGDGSVVCIVSGANINFNSIRFVIDHAQPHGETAEPVLAACGGM